MSEEQTKPSRCASFLDLLGSAKVTTYCLALLMILTFWGTLYQVENGLYLAKEKFFDSWFFLAAGFVPFPGTQLILAVLAINLIAYLIRLGMRRRIPFGLLVIHLGLLVLLMGGAITHLFARETQLTLAEGETGSASASYGNWEVAVWSQDGNTRDVMAYDSNHLKPGDTLRFDDAGLTLKVIEYYRNARALSSPLRRQRTRRSANWAFQLFAAPNLQRSRAKTSRARRSTSSPMKENPSVQFFFRRTRFPPNSATTAKTFILRFAAHATRFHSRSNCWTSRKRCTPALESPAHSPASSSSTPTA
ncbi:MAG: hypothetical protein M5U15_14810 [Kiritimatiellae bacterium]|nr:hypothetical protein [Kiritimatiellia bacterium]